jgi:FK506-binding protein 1
MGVEKVVVKPGNGMDYPKKHDEVSMEYTGSTNISWLGANI